MIQNDLFSPWPSYSQEEADAVQSVILSNRVNYWTGNQCRLFESEFALSFGAHHAVALANGTVALDVALSALGIRHGDEVIVTPRTFIASVSAVINAGATPIFADIDTESGNITAETIERVISPRTKAIICVHLAGWPCEMDSIMTLAESHEIKVIEDCAQAHGARYKGHSVGSIGHIGTWSFCQDKIMTTCGEGGMVTTNDQALWSYMWSYKDHGKSYEAVYQREHAPGFRWLHDSFGTNWRMLEVQAAVGLIQLRRMPNWHKQRSDNAQRIWRTAQLLPGLRVPQIPDHIDHAAYKCYMYIEDEQLKSNWNRDRIIHEINELGVPCLYGSCPEVYLEKAFDNSGFRPEKRLPVAKELGETSILFLVHPTLSDQAITMTCEALSDIMTKACK